MHTSDYQPIDFVANGQASSVEESDFMNDMRRQGMEAAAKLRLSNPEFEKIPAQFQTVIASMVMMGMDPGNFYNVTAPNGSKFMLGTLKAPGDIFTVFEMHAPPSAVDDQGVMARNVSHPMTGETTFETLDEAVALLSAVAMMDQGNGEFLFNLSQAEG